MCRFESGFDLDAPMTMTRTKNGVQTTRQSTMAATTRSDLRASTGAVRSGLAVAAGGAVGMTTAA
jgi:hypothetical protein